MHLGINIDPLAHFPNKVEQRSIYFRRASRSMSIPDDLSNEHFCLTACTNLKTQNSSPCSFLSFSISTFCRRPHWLSHHHHHRHLQRTPISKSATPTTRVISSGALIMPSVRNIAKTGNCCSDARWPHCTLICICTLSHRRIKPIGIILPLSIQ